MQRKIPMVRGGYNIAGGIYMSKNKHKNYK